MPHRARCATGPLFRQAPLGDDDDVERWWDLGTGSKQTPRSRGAGIGDSEELSKQEMDDLVQRNGGT